MNITFIMAVYNAAATLEEAIESLINQDSPNWKLICVDDGSNDNSKAIIEEFANRDSRITLLTQTNAGPAVARAKGIVAADTEYIGILDSDDKLSLDFVSMSLKYITRYNADVAVPDLVDFGSDDLGFSQTLFERMNEHEGMCYWGGNEAFSLALDWHIHGCAVFESSLIKKYYTQEIVGYSRFNSDEFATRLLYLKCKKVVLSSAKYFYRMSHSSITKKPSLKMLERIDTSVKLLDLAVAENMGNCMEANMYSGAMFLILYMMSFLQSFQNSEKNKGIAFVHERYSKLRARFKFGYLKDMPLSVALKIMLLNSGFGVLAIIGKLKQ